MAEHISSVELVAIRTRLRLTQKEMADALGVPRGTYKNWEYGQGIPVRYAIPIRRIGASQIPKIGKVVLFRTDDGKITVKQLKHDGKDFILHPLNPKYDDHLADGSVVGFLVGKVRQLGRRKLTDYDPDGLTPEVF